MCFFRTQIRIRLNPQRDQWLQTYHKQGEGNPLFYRRGPCRLGVKGVVAGNDIVPRMSVPPQERQLIAGNCPVVKGPGCVERGLYERHC
jgi:hypothetical protein